MLKKKYDVLKIIRYTTCSKQSDIRHVENNQTLTCWKLSDIQHVENS